MANVDDIIDRASCFLFALFGVNWFIALGLNVPYWTETLLPALMSNFSMTPPATPFDYTSNQMTTYGGCWALGSVLPNIIALQGPESADVKASRQLANLGGWFGWMLGAGLWSYKGGQGGYFGSPFNIFWNVLFSVMVYYHLKWVGGPAGVMKKLKLA